MHGQLRVALGRQGLCSRDHRVRIGDGIEGRSGDVGRRRRVEGGRVAIPPSALLTDNVAHDVLGAAVRPAEPRVAEDVVGVIEIGEDVALTEAAVESLDDLVSQPTEGVDGGGQPFVDEVRARHMRAELDDQDVGPQFDQPVEGVRPSAGETQGTLRGADVGDEVGRHRRTGVESASLGEPHRDGVVGLRRSPEQLDPRGFG